MAKLFALAAMQSGVPDIDFTVTPVNGFVLADQLGGQGAYLFGGTPAQLLAINALPQVVGIVSVSEAGGVRWAELDGVIAPAVRTKINNWLQARGLADRIPAGWTYRQTVVAIFKRLNDNFSLDQFDVSDT